MENNFKRKNKDTYAKYRIGVYIGMSDEMSPFY